MANRLSVHRISPVRAAAMWEPALDELCSRTDAMWAATGTEQLDARWLELAAFAPVYAQLDYDRAYQTSMLVMPDDLVDVVGSLGG